MFPHSSYIPNKCFKTVVPLLLNSGHQLPGACLDRQNADRHIIPGELFGDEGIDFVGLFLSCTENF